ncbi:FMN-dependent NADH-azoreductase [Melghirimyces algeriensis]|uniref:FMN dependent NADH:quinone oxidoreductase n=1 Tax=Melghirimyces algeriensis TaxID=910412 RepID=A0A521ERI5_9BACL|nr:FMN-dependent NADH-azoreductase [Melghirimyces algeriensis]SMO86544.1 FMN-dependent NADH-azoreductase [Melghirimyces algeriensis]
MGKVLYITANPKAAKDSYSLTVADEVIRTYRKINSADEVIHLDLFQEEIPLIDGDILEAWGKLGSGASFESLTDSQQKKVARQNELLEQFMEADRYVIAIPMWNFGVPPLMKAYIDNVAIAGKTFKYTEEGPVGLLQGKKALIVQASGGVYSEGPAAELDFASRSLKAVLNLVGVTDVETVYVEGVSQYPDQVDEIREKAIKQANEKAKTFAQDTVVPS